MRQKVEYAPNLPTIVYRRGQMTRAELLTLTAAILMGGSPDPNTGETYTIKDALRIAEDITTLAERYETARSEKEDPPVP